ncbi:2S seed storage protein-like protein [Tanacetum coccineum]
MYLQQGQSFFEDNHNGQKQQTQILQHCFNKLQNVRQQCQCEAVKQVFQDVQQIEGQVGAQQIRQLKQEEIFISADGIKSFLLIMFLLVMFSFLLTEIESAGHVLISADRDIESADLIYRRDYCMQEL